MSRTTVKDLETRVNAIEENIKKQNDLLQQMMAMLSSNPTPVATETKPNSRTRQASKPKTEEKPVEHKNHYTPFNKETDSYKAISVPSKSGNPDALLTISFVEIPSVNTRNLIKGFGFKWNNNTKVWYNVNTPDAQKVFLVL